MAFYLKKNQERATFLLECYREMQPCCGLDLESSLEGHALMFGCQLVTFQKVIGDSGH